MTTYITDRHGQRWALVPERATQDMCAAFRVNAEYEFFTTAQVWAAMLTAAPEFEPREPTPEELDAVMPEEDMTVPPFNSLSQPVRLWTAGGVRIAMRAALALIWSTK